MLAVFQTVPEGHGAAAGTSDGGSGNIRGSSHWRSSTFQTLPFGQRRSSPLVVSDSDDSDDREGGEAEDWQIKLPGVLTQV